jgi:hypothetical protein
MHGLSPLRTDSGHGLSFLVFQFTSALLVLWIAKQLCDLPTNQYNYIKLSFHIAEEYCMTFQDSVCRVKNHTRARLNWFYLYKYLYKYFFKVLFQCIFTSVTTNINNTGTKFPWKEMTFQNCCCNRIGATLAQAIILLEEFHLLSYNALKSVENQPTFRMNILPPSSGS